MKEEEKQKKKKKVLRAPQKILQEKDESKVNFFFPSLGSFSPGEGKRGRRGGEGGDLLHA